MAEGTYQQLQWFVSQGEVRRPSTASSAPSSSYPEQNSASSSSSQRRQSSFPANPSQSVEKSKSAAKRRSTSKTLSSSAREGPPRAPSGMMNDPANEITYTPTTHRISKAKKGKKVHACEYPGCTKVGTMRISNRQVNRLIQTPDFHQSGASKVS